MFSIKESFNESINEEHFYVLKFFTHLMGVPQNSNFAREWARESKYTLTSADLSTYQLICRSFTPEMLRLLPAKLAANDIFQDIKIDPGMVKINTATSSIVFVGSFLKDQIVLKMREHLINQHGNEINDVLFNIGDILKKSQTGLISQASALQSINRLSSAVANNGHQYDPYQAYKSEFKSVNTDGFGYGC
jgi:hypothetical protein